MTTEVLARWVLITSRILMGLIAIAIAGSGIAKLMLAQPIVDALGKVGLGHYVQAIGAAELLYVALFLAPPTRKVGFLLLTAHLGGALATEVALHGAPASAMLMAVLWIAMFLSDRTLFLATRPQAQP